MNNKKYHFREGTINEAIEIIFQPINTSGISQWKLIDDIEALLPDNFKGKLSGNGSSVFQNDRGMGKKYVIQKEYSDEGTHRITAVRLAGYSTAIQNARSSKIPKHIRVVVTKDDCCVCGTGSKIECDHKNGRKDTSNDVDETNIKHFQPLCSHCNKVKREVCKSCNITGKRFDARKKGFAKGWIKGSAKFQPASLGCEGCYWYDPIQFIKSSCK